MSSSSVPSCTSAAANHRVWDVCAANVRLGAAAWHHELGHQPRLEIVRAHVLLDLQLHPIARGPQVVRTEDAIDAERSRWNAPRPVAVDVHVAREQRAVVAADRDDKDGN